MSDKFLETVMDENYLRKLTICGSAKFRELKEKYQAYYTIKNNLVFAPVNYLLIKNEVETSADAEQLIAISLAKVHDMKIDLSEAIIVVCPDCYIGSHTMREFLYARENDKRILFTDVPETDKNNYYFNGDLTYPLYMLKEE